MSGYLIDDRQYLIRDIRQAAKDGDTFKWDGNGTPPDENGQLWRTVMGKKVQFTVGKSVKEAYKKAGLTEDGRRPDDDDPDSFVPDPDQEDEGIPVEELLPGDRHYKVNELELLRAKHREDQEVYDLRVGPMKELGMSQVEIRRELGTTINRLIRGEDRIRKLKLWLNINGHEYRKGEPYTREQLVEQGILPDVDAKDVVGYGRRPRKGNPLAEVPAREFPRSFEPDGRFRNRAMKADIDMSQRTKDVTKRFWDGMDPAWYKTMPVRERRRLMKKFDKWISNKRFKPDSISVKSVGGMRELENVMKTWAGIPDHLLERFNEIQIRPSGSGTSHGKNYWNLDNKQSVIKVWVGDGKDGLRTGNILRHEITHSVWRTDLDDDVRREWTRRIGEINYGITEYAESYRSGRNKGQRGKDIVEGFGNESMCEFLAIANRNDDESARALQKDEPYNQEVFDAMSRIFTDITGRDPRWDTWKESDYRRGDWRPQKW